MSCQIKHSPILAMMHGKKTTQDKQTNVSISEIIIKISSSPLC